MPKLPEYGVLRFAEHVLRLVESRPEAKPWTGWCVIW